ncbi:type IV secretory pathway, VirD4 component [Phenylobacterium zucineum HLK1]|uniref:Type IV secretory pathway, VirD4 component n=1 Tax=Phenylobacterium zucineum (strain HLK1) TaxID=450851 RepID=B4RFV4_PHEZH|nr:type IV secretory system conjugative DNA transfer family protein [Phenylobacterium zucineum]ACG78767.1 type IV secretory pathway, VirD4 component [Phenylobacterium zucineum HLK1]
MAALVALAGLGRLSPDIDPAAIPGWFWYFRGDPEVRRWARIGLLISTGLGALVTVGALRGLRRPLHGAARWASEIDLRRAGLRARDGVLLGRRNGAPLAFGGSEHVMLYAPTRTGKGVGVVVPNLLNWPHSVVCLDVKGENWAASAGFRAAQGQKVYFFDPLEAEGRTARYNPLGHIDRRDPTAVLDELQKLAVMLFPAPPGADPFWAEAARTGFIGVGAYVAATPELPFSVGAIYTELTRGDPRARFPREMAARRAAGRPFHWGCEQALADFCASSENTFASVRQTLTSRLNLWLSPRVCAATQTSDFDLRTFRDEPQSLYLATSPDNLTRVAPLYNLLFQQLIDLNTREPPTSTFHTVPVLVLLDEFARLGHAPVLAHAFAYVAGYGLRLLPVLQSPAQLRAEYGRDLAEEIIANCGVEIAFAPKELKVAQELSERLGYTTVSSPSRSRPSGLARGHRSVSESEQRRALMLPQELLQLASDALIVLRAGVPPVRGRKIVYFRERVFIRRLRSPPVVPKLSVPIAMSRDPPVASDAVDDPLTLDAVTRELAARNLEPPPPPAASEDDVADWIDRFIDAAVPPATSDREARSER